MKLLRPFVLIIALLLAALSPGCMGLFGKDTPAATGDETTEDDELLDDGLPDTGTGGENTATGNESSGGDQAPATGSPTASFVLLREAGATEPVMRGHKGEPLTLDASASRTGAGTAPVSYAWEIQEGANVSANHSGALVENVTFTTEGTKLIRLTVRDAEGRTATTERTYYVDLLLEVAGSHTWPKPVVNRQEYTESYDVTILDGGRNGILEVNWTTAQVARITLATPLGTPLVDQDVRGSSATISFQDAATFASPGTYKLTIRLTYTPDSGGVPVHTSPTDPTATFDADLKVYYGMARTGMPGSDGASGCGDTVCTP